MNIGFIGTGVMGAAIAKHFMDAGHDLVVYNRTKSKTDELVQNGAKWVVTPKLVAERTEVVFSMVGFPKDVDSIYFGENGIFAGLQPGSIVVDMTTSTPSLAIKINKEAHRHNSLALDAPVSGGDVGARNGQLTVMVGGDQAAFEKMNSLFELIGKRVNYFGEAGAGQHTKMANQIMIAGTMTGLTEMLLYAKKASLPLQQVLDTLSSGGADNWSMANYVPRILAQDYTPGFFAKHFLKDLRIALDEAEKMGLNLPATKLAKELYETMVDQDGLGDEGTQALIKTYTGWKD